MQTQPDIVMTETDLDRLERLLESMPVHSPNRIALETELERANVVPSGQIPANVVTMNSTVLFSVNGTTEQSSLTLVYPKDMRDDGSTVSVLAPAGSAILGLKEGDEINWPSADGKALKIRIDEVTYQPERAGELHR